MEPQCPSHHKTPPATPIQSVCSFTHPTVLPPSPRSLPSRFSDKNGILISLLPMHATCLISPAVRDLIILSEEDKLRLLLFIYLFTGRTEQPSRRRMALYKHNSYVATARDEPQSASMRSFLRPRIIFIPLIKLSNPLSTLSTLRPGILSFSWFPSIPPGKYRVGP
jgi:hypothetical protein